jgi:hypothetical protein|tara:strand:+ start:3320 stop:4159 length:840 start_codon:yes stop_codon:yes gene_type:complete
MIPKIIHQTWKTKDLPSVFDFIYKHNIQSNTNFIFNLWTDNNTGNNIDDFIKNNYPRIYNVYSNIKLGVQKSDIARLTILHYYGGIYIDLDILLLKSLDNLFDYNKDLLYISYEPTEQTTYLWNKDNYICNAFFACSPKNIIIEDILNNIVMIYENFGNQIYNKFNVFGSNIFSITINLPKFKNNFEIIDTHKIYPINDIKLDSLSCSYDDFQKLKFGTYDNSYMVHYWIHSNFESKKLLYNYKFDVNLTIHTNIYLFFKLLYPNNKNILLDNNYITKY